MRILYIQLLVNSCAGSDCPVARGNLCGYCISSCLRTLVRTAIVQLLEGTCAEFEVVQLLGVLSSDLRAGDSYVRRPVQ